MFPKAWDTAASCGASDGRNKDHGTRTGRSDLDSGENTLPLWAASTLILSTFFEQDTATYNFVSKILVEQGVVLHQTDVCQS